ncbi:serine/threonine protein phosphatase [Thermomonas sp.]|uniref:serine/threonine protein phosphatase n=1 Tax=Thermomonas sp. TaxID=1971895 RepID=UPI002619C8EA|nr:serine/threonine protein phosphatase [Thermomonas sp.]
MKNEEHTVIRMDVLGRKAWLKVFVEGERRFKLNILDLAARRLGVPALRPPPHRGGEHACATEKRRLEELAACGACVPEVLGHGPRALLIGDIGVSLKTRLHETDAAGKTKLIVQAAQALGQVHGNGGHIGQPFARNLTVTDDGQIGFLDLEEDPRETMTLAQAQVRDWLIFAAGVSRYFADPAVELADALRPAVQKAAPEVRTELAQAVRQLGIVERIAWKLGERARRIAGALTGLRNALAE